MRNSDDSDDVSTTAKRAAPAATLNENASKRAATGKSTAGATESKEATMTAILQRSDGRSESRCGGGEARAGEAGVKRGD